METGEPVGAQAGEAELAARLRMVVVRTNRRLRQAVDLAVTPSQLSALSSVDRLGPLTLGELAAVEQIQPPSMTRIVAKLEDAGLVSRQVDEADRRVAHVHVTAEGKRQLQRSRSRKNEYLARRLRALDGSRLRTLAEAVGILEALVGAEE